MDAFEVAVLRSEAEQADRQEQAERQKQHERSEQLKAIGRERLKTLIPADVKAVIVAELHEDDSDSMTDYYGYHTKRTVILGFSGHTKDLFSEMRKYAANFDQTAYLATENKDYEHREKYSMGDGYYLGKSKYSGWTVSKERINDRDKFIERFALVAGEENSICVKVRADKIETASEAVTGDFIIVDYSQKALAVFGDTRPVKDGLKALGGRFNPKLTHEGQKKAGWIFSKAREQVVKNYFVLNILYLFTYSKISFLSLEKLL
jgi:hypothetical protein